MKIARVFPRITKATPDDDMCFFTPPPMLTLPEIDEVHVSCVFTYDRGKAEELAYQWEVVGVPVKIGGPAYDDPAEGDCAGALSERGLRDNEPRVQQPLLVLLCMEARGEAAGAANHAGVECAGQQPFAML